MNDVLRVRKLLAQDKKRGRLSKFRVNLFAPYSTQLDRGTPPPKRLRRGLTNIPAQTEVSGPNKRGLARDLHSPESSKNSCADP